MKCPSCGEKFHTEVVQGEGGGAGCGKVLNEIILDPAKERDNLRAQNQIMREALKEADAMCDAGFAFDLASPLERSPIKEALAKVRELEGK